jgi:hypothetical protein
MQLLQPNYARNSAGETSDMPRRACRHDGEIADAAALLIRAALDACGP